MLKLENICFESIVKNFEWHFTAFSKDENLKKDYSFFQRNYSNKCLEALDEEGKLQEKYFELLINKHVTYFEGKWLKSRKNINSIFSNLPNLIKIQVSSKNGWEDEILKNISKFCPKITEIDADDSCVSDVGMHFLSETRNRNTPCPNLKNISVYSTYVTDMGAKLLIRNIPSLERIGYRNVPDMIHSIYKENLQESNEVQYYNLIALNFLNMDRYDYNSRILKTCLTACPKLEELACRVRDEQLSVLSFTENQLKKFDFRPTSTAKRYINFDDFLKMKGGQLTHLKIMGCSTMSISVLSTYCPKLEEFEAWELNFTCDGIFNTSFESLTKCVLDDIKPRAVCIFLSSSPKLESISLSHSYFSPKMKTHILMWCENSSAKEIHFGKVSIVYETEFLMTILSKCPSLRRLSIADNLDEEDATTYEQRKQYLRNFAETLPNKPRVTFPCFLDDFKGRRHSRI